MLFQYIYSSVTFSHDVKIINHPSNKLLLPIIASFYPHLDLFQLKKNALFYFRNCNTSCAPLVHVYISSSHIIHISL